MSEHQGQSVSRDFGTNAIINLGVKLGTAYGDPFLDIGLDLELPPSTFWWLDPLLRFVKRFRWVDGV